MTHNPRSSRAIPGAGATTRLCLVERRGTTGGNLPKSVDPGRQCLNPDGGSLDLGTAWCGAAARSAPQMLDQADEDARLQGLVEDHQTALVRQRQQLG